MSASKLGVGVKNEGSDEKEDLQSQERDRGGEKSLISKRRRGVLYPVARQAREK
jgi:hypothetical protein